MKQSSQIAAPEDGVHFVDIMPEPPKDAVMIVHRINGKDIAAVWVAREHGGTPAQPFPELVEGAWVFWHRRFEAVNGSSDASPDRPRPRTLELL